MCPNCVDKELYFQDDSFTHQFRIEINRYYYCEECGYTIDEGEVNE